MAAESGPNEVRVATQHPIRTCIGCRQRAEATDLLRVVAQRGGDAVAQAVQILPDPRRRLPGRGAWVHRDSECVALAERRRAFGRALRVPGEVDPAPLREYVAGADW
jgi:predicted RNA-binding protein YlxR (DUF448 family)